MQHEISKLYEKGLKAISNRGFGMVKALTHNQERTTYYTGQIRVAPRFFAHILSYGRVLGELNNVILPKMVIVNLTRDYE